MELTTLVDGITVKGRNISKSNDMVIVVITQPYHDLIARRHIPTSIPWREGTGGMMREEFSLRLLEQIYKARHHLELHREPLRAELEKEKGDSEFPSLSSAALFQRKLRELRKQLEAGTLTRQDYDEQIVDTRFHSNYLASCSISILEAFFSENFPDPIKDELRAQLLVLLVD